jgi:hypothetical protein
MSGSQAAVSWGFWRALSTWSLCRLASNSSPSPPHMIEDSNDVVEPRIQDPYWEIALVFGAGGWSRLFGGPTSFALTTAHSWPVFQDLHVLRACPLAPP